MSLLGRDLTFPITTDGRAWFILISPLLAPYSSSASPSSSRDLHGEVRPLHVELPNVAKRKQLDHACKQWSHSWMGLVMPMKTASEVKRARKIISLNPEGKQHRRGCITTRQKRYTRQRTINQKCGNTRVGYWNLINGGNQTKIKCEFWDLISVQQNMELFNCALWCLLCTAAAYTHKQATKST